MKTSLKATSATGAITTRSTNAAYTHVVIWIGTEETALRLEAKRDELAATVTDADRQELADMLAASKAAIVGYQDWINATPRYYDHPEDKGRSKAAYVICGQIEKHPAQILERRQNSAEHARLEAGRIVEATWHSRLDLAQKAQAQAAADVATEIVECEEITAAELRELKKAAK